MKKFNVHQDLSQLIPVEILNRLIKKWGVDKNIRRLSTTKLIKILLQSFILRLHSLREMQDVFDVPKSTLADALKKRSAGFFEELVHEVAKKVLTESKNSRLKKLLKPLVAIDSTEARVHGHLLNFKGWKKSKNKCASLKLHVAWNIEGEWIEDFRTTYGNASDLTTAKSFELSPGKIYVGDRAYVDLKFWLIIQKAQADFVIRAKKTLRLSAIHAQVLNEDDLKKDGVIMERKWLASEATCYRANIKPKNQVCFRHIIYRDPVSKKLFDFLTSDWKRPAQEIADIYKRRWSVELLFRWLKGHLHLRVLDLRNPNTVKIHAAMLVLTQLLLQLEKILTQFNGTLWEFLRKLRTTMYHQIIAPIGFPGSDNSKHPPSALFTQ